jgi:hypothetical protein
LHRNYSYYSFYAIVVVLELDELLLLDDVELVVLVDVDVLELVLDEVLELLVLLVLEVVLVAKAVSRIYQVAVLPDVAV